MSYTLRHEKTIKICLWSKPHIRKKSQIHIGICKQTPNALRLSENRRNSIIKNYSQRVPCLQPTRGILTELVIVSCLAHELYKDQLAPQKMESPIISISRTTKKSYKQHLLTGTIAASEVRNVLQKRESFLHI